MQTRVFPRVEHAIESSQSRALVPLNRRKLLRDQGTRMRDEEEMVVVVSGIC
jgi:chorismate synthase